MFKRMRIRFGDGPQERHWSPDGVAFFTPGLLRKVLNQGKLFRTQLVEIWFDLYDLVF